MTFWTDLTGVPHRLAWADAGGVPTRYLEAGDGPHTVVFLHGVNGHLEVFLRNIAAHAARYRVIALDQLGHGYTGKPDRRYEIDDYLGHLSAFLDAVGADRLSIAGTSLGGWVSARFAARNPQRVASLSLISAGGLTAYAGVMNKIKSLGAKAGSGREAVRERLAFVIKDPANITEELIDARWDIYRRPDYQAALPNLLCLQDPEIRARNLLTEAELGTITAPTLVLWTEDDPTATVEDGRRYADAIPGARFEVFDQSSHMPQFEEPDRFNALHLEFLEAALDK
jgi:2-hydroxy-6-oxonona-2,4-dienedioate hydrolase